MFIIGTNCPNYYLTGLKIPTYVNKYLHVFRWFNDVGIYVLECQIKDLSDLDVVNFN